MHRLKRIILFVLILFVAFTILIFKGYFSFSVRNYLKIYAKREGMVYYEEIIDNILMNHSLKLIDDSSQRVRFDVDKAYYLMGLIMKTLRTKTDVLDDKKIEIPVSYLFLKKAFLLPNIKIPVKTSSLKSYEVEITSSVEEYGINSSLVGIYLIVNISYDIMIPLITELVTLNIKFPLSLEIINGEVPKIALRY